MTTITFVEHTGAEHTVEARQGKSLMKAATENGVPGIDAICGGCCTCSTCHCYVDAPWGQHLPPPSEAEQAVLASVVDLRPESRLSCQITVTAQLDGMIVRLPEFQG